MADRTRHLGDFTTSPRVLVISGIAIVVVNTATIASIMLLDLIRLGTSLTYFGRFSLSYLRLGKSPLGVAAVVWLLSLATANCR